MRVSVLLVWVLVWWGAIGCSGSIEADPIDIGEVDCSEGADPLPSPMTADHPRVFWSEDEQLRDALGAALARLRAATGIDLELGQGPDTTTAMAGTRELPHNVLGHTTDHRRIDIDPDAADMLEAVVLHEAAHVLGARHVGPWEGVMSRCIEVGGGPAPLLTTEDLMQICAASSCAYMAPEAGGMAL